MTRSGLVFQWFSGASVGFAFAWFRVGGDPRVIAAMLVISILLAWLAMGERIQFPAPSPQFPFPDLGRADHE